MMYIFDSAFLNVLTYILIVFVSLSYYYTNKANYWKHRGVKCAPVASVFVNLMNIIFAKSNILCWFGIIYDLFPDEKFVGLLGSSILLKDPTLIHNIMIKDFGYFIDRNEEFLDNRIDFISLNLFLLRGQKWRTLRRKLSPIFSSGKLKSMRSRLTDCVRLLADNLANSGTHDSAQEMNEAMIRYSSDVIGTCTFGVPPNALSDPAFRTLLEYITKPTFALRQPIRLFANAIHPDVPYYLNLQFFPTTEEKLFVGFVKNILEQTDENNVKSADFIKILADLRNQDLLKNSHVEDGSFVLNDVVISGNAFLFYIAGNETTPAAMSFALLELAANPSIQQEVRDEIALALDKHDGALDYNTIKDLPYMEMVIQEALRKYPPFYFLFRNCTKTYCIPDSSVVIEKGTQVMIPLFSIHRDPRYFPDPERFDPQRFSPENKAKIIPGTFLPFGEGPRHCPARQFSMMEMKYAFCEIISKFRFTLSDKTEYPVKFKQGFYPVLTAADGIWLNATRIQHE